MESNLDRENDKANIKDLDEIYFLWNILIDQDKKVSKNKESIQNVLEYLIKRHGGVQEAFEKILLSISNYLKKSPSPKEGLNHLNNFSQTGASNLRKIIQILNEEDDIVGKAFPASKENKNKELDELEAGLEKNSNAKEIFKILKEAKQSIDHTQE